MDLLLDPFAHGTIPFGDWVEAFIRWLVENFRGLLLATKQPVQGLLVRQATQELPGVFKPEFHREIKQKMAGIKLPVVSILGFLVSETG